MPWYKRPVVFLRGAFLAFTLKMSPARRVLFVGTPRGLESRLVPRAGYPLASRSEAWLEALIDLYAERMETLTQFAQAARFFFVDADLPEPSTHWLFRTTWSDEPDTSDIDTRVFGPAADPYTSPEDPADERFDPDWYGPYTLGLLARSPYRVQHGTVWPFDTSSGANEKPLITDDGQIVLGFAAGGRGGDQRVACGGGGAGEPCACGVE